MILFLLLIATLFLAYANGANDNFKGVATLFGSGTTDYRKAVLWATLTTVGGSICAIFISQELVENFSGKSLVSARLVEAPAFLCSVGLSAALTVMLATLLGFPISTTHALSGGLLGAGLIAVGTDFNFSTLGIKFVLPLLVSPLLASIYSGLLYFIMHRLRVAADCDFISQARTLLPPSASIIPGGPVAHTKFSDTQYMAKLEDEIAKPENDVHFYKGHIRGISYQSILDHAHYLSAGVVCFARGLNDTPKIVALLLLVKSVNLSTGMILVALSMTLGGLLNARKIAVTMSKKIAGQNHGQGFVANLVTASLVICSSLLGAPVSTTHVAVGSIVGVGIVSKKAHWNMIGQIALAWALTLPLAAFLSAVIYALMR